MDFMYVVVNACRSMNINDSFQGSTVSAPEYSVIIVIDFILVCTSAVGAIGNILIIFVICRTRSLRTAMNANLVSLAVADLIVCCFLLPIRLILYNHIYTDVYSINVLCKIDVFVKTTCDSAQLFMLVATSFERFQSIARPFEKQGLGRRTAGSLSAAWLLSIGLGIFNSQYCGDGATLYPCYAHNTDIFEGYWGYKEKNITLPLGLFCLLLVIVFYGRILKLLNEHNTTMQKRFKNKVNPSQKLVEKSTSNAVLKINSTIHNPIGKEKDNTSLKVKDGVKVKNGNLAVESLQNGTQMLPKSTTLEDSGYNENEPTVHVYAPKYKQGNALEKMNKDNNQSVNEQKQIKAKCIHTVDPEKSLKILAKDQGAQTQKVYGKQSENNTVLKENNNALSSWRSIIKDRLFGTSLNQQSPEEITEPITVLKLNETKRFPLVRERVTLAQIEEINKNFYSGQDKSDLNLQNHRPIARAKSLSEIYKHSALNKIQNVFVASSYSLAALQKVDMENSIMKSRNQISSCESKRNQTNTSSNASKFALANVDETDLKSLQKLSSSAQISQKNSKENVNSKSNDTDIIKNDSEEIDQLKQNTNMSKFKVQNEVSVKFYQASDRETGAIKQDTNMSKFKVQDEVCVKYYKPGDRKTDTLEPNSNMSKFKVQDEVCVKYYKPGDRKTGTLEQNSKMSKFKVQDEVCIKFYRSGDRESHEKAKPNLSGIKSNENNIKDQQQFNTNVHGDFKNNDRTDLKEKLKQGQLKQVEVVDMDGTVHRKVKVESGAVVGAVCVMNNSNRVQGRRKVEMRTAKNIAILIGTFILLWLPLPVVVIIFSSSVEITQVTVEPVLIIASASSLTVALNPILNVLLNKQMRSRTISTLKNCKKVIR